MNKEKVTILGLVIAIIVLFVLRGNDIDELYLNQLETTVEELFKANENLLLENTKIEIELDLKKDSIILLESEVAEIEYKKILLRKYYEKKINNINNLNVSQLDSVFSSRYGR